MPKLSVVIPVYNTKPYLRRCLDSVCGQSFRDLEVVCVDDGSTDGSSDLLAEYASTDSRVKLIRQDNAGQGVARNRALEQVGGEFIHFMDSDDELRPGAYERLIGLMERQDLDHIIFSAEVCCDKGIEEKLVKKKDSYQCEYSPPADLVGRVLVGEVLCERLLVAGKFFDSPTLRILRRSVLSDPCCRFVEGVIHEDAYFSPFATMRSRRAMMVSDRCYVRYIRSGSTMHVSGANRRHLVGVLAVYVKMAQTFASLSEGDSCRRLAEANLRRLWKSCLWRAVKVAENEYEEVLTCLKKVLPSVAIENVEFHLLPALRESSRLLLQAKKEMRQGVPKRRSGHLRKIIRTVLDLW